jgi:sensor histidine kinase YesM
MRLFRKDWTPREADEWTAEDWIAVIVSPVIYILLTVGVMLSMLLMTVGFVMLASAIVLLVVLVRVINPKLSAISEGYEKKQREYIEELERKVKWEDS